MRRTPYYALMQKHGGKFVEFGGYEMPIQFEHGIVVEHNAVRNNVGLFDVSHMGEVIIEGPRAEETVNTIVSNDIRGMEDGQIRYTLMCNDNGGIIDDFLVYRMSSTKFLLVVNAGNRDKDVKWIADHCTNEKDAVWKDASDEMIQFAVQGPKSPELMKAAFPDETLPEGYYTFSVHTVDGFEVILSRTGYTGEDGFEIYGPNAWAEKLFNRVVDAGKPLGLELCGLGCRDTLRLEAGMPLYGHELTEDFLATEVTLKPFVRTEKDDFIGKAALEANPPKKIRKGIVLLDRGIARDGAKVFLGDKEIGVVTSGTHSPTLGKAIAQVRVDRGIKETDVLVEVRGKKLKAVLGSANFLKGR